MQQQGLTPQATIEAMLKRSHRQEVPIRRSFVRRENNNGRPPLAELVHRHDDRALDLYLLILAQASAGAFDVSYPAAVWARALSLGNKDGAAAVSKVLARLVDAKLVKRDRVGRKAHITLLHESGSGDAYTHPGQVRDKYLKLPHAYWTDGWSSKLALPGKAALLVARSMPATFFLSIETAPKQFGFSADTLEDGLRELRAHGLLDRWTIQEPDPLTVVGYRLDFRYKLRSPLEHPSRSRAPGAGAAAADPTVLGIP